MRTKTPLIGPDPQGFNELCKTLADLDPDEIYAAGLRDGARRERRALKRYLDTEPCSEATELRLWLRYARPAQLRRLASRKRKGGKND